MAMAMKIFLAFLCKICYNLLKQTEGEIFMKKVLSIVLCLAAVFALTSTAAVTTAGAVGMIEYTIENGNAVVTGCSGDVSGNITFPDTVGGKPIVKIAQNAFRKMDKLTGIMLPDTITVISNGAFSECENLSMVILPKSLKTLGNYAFYNCPQLQSIYLPEGLTEVGEGAFEQCTGLKFITIPGSVKAINGYAFYNCRSLEMIDIPSSVTEIGASAFALCTNLSTAVMREGLKYINEGAFMDCFNLKAVIVPKSVQKIGDYSLSYYVRDEDDQYYYVDLMDGVVIYGAKGSAAATYAKNADADVAFKEINTSSIISSVRSKYPYATDKQIYSCIGEVAKSKPNFSTSDVVNYASKLNYDFPTVTGDFDGDGKADTAQFYSVKHNQAYLDVMYSTGSNFERSTVWDSGRGWYVDSFKDDMLVGDFNGDGMDDIAAFYDYGNGQSRLFVWISTCRGFKLQWGWWYMKSGFYNSNITGRVVAGDFNGDGKDDICALYDYGKGQMRAFVWQSTGSAFNLKWGWWHMQSGFYGKDYTDRMVAGDFNGDGKDDVCGFYDYGKGETRAFVWQSGGDSFSLKWDYWYMKNGFYPSAMNNRMVAGDFDGDGKDDICGFYDYGKGELRAFVWHANGNNKFSLQWGWWYMPSGFYGSTITDHVTAGDFDGDGKCDIGAYYRYNNGTGREFVYKSSGTKFDLKWNWWFGMA